MLQAAGHPQAMPRPPHTPGLPLFSPFALTSGAVGCLPQRAL